MTADNSTDFTTFTDDQLKQLGITREQLIAAQQENQVVDADRQEYDMAKARVRVLLIAVLTLLDNLAHARRMQILAFWTAILTQARENSEADPQAVVRTTSPEQFLATITNLADPGRPATAALPKDSTSDVVGQIIQELARAFDFDDIQSFVIGLRDVLMSIIGQEDGNANNLLTHLRDMAGAHSPANPNRLQSGGELLVHGTAERMERELSDAEREIERLKQEISDLRTRNGQLGNQLATANRRADTAQERVTELEGDAVAYEELATLVRNLNAGNAASRASRLQQAVDAARGGYAGLAAVANNLAGGDAATRDARRTQVGLAAQGHYLGFDDVDLLRVIARNLAAAGDAATRDRRRRNAEAAANGTLSDEHRDANIARDRYGMFLTDIARHLAFQQLRTGRGGNTEATYLTVGLPALEEATVTDLSMRIPIGTDLKLVERWQAAVRSRS